MKIVNLGFDSAVWYNKDGSIRLPLPNQLQAETKYKHSFKERNDRINKLKSVIDTTLPGVGDQEIPGEEWFKGDLASIFFNRTKSDFDYKLYSLEYLELNPEVRFLYPISIFTQHAFKNINQIYLPANLLQCIYRGQAKIHMHVVWEGFLFDDPFFSFNDYHMHPKDFLDAIHSFMDSYNLPNNSLLISSANLRSKEIVDSLLNGQNKRFKIFELDWFKISKWCLKGNEEGISDKFNSCLTSKKFVKHFLSMNRVSRPHRTIIYSELSSNDKLKDKVEISFSKISPELKKQHFNLLDDKYKHNKKRLLNVNCSEDKTLDVEFTNLSTDYYTIPVNLAFTFAWDFHNSTFVNVVSETLVSSSSVFITEKVHKPILTAQPFVVVSSPFYLKKLKELGFKTFDNFWDESYDLEEDFTKRFEKIVDTLEYISTWSLEKCNRTYNQMIPILKHNFNVYMDTTHYKEHLQFMYCECVGTTKNLM